MSDQSRPNVLLIVPDDQRFDTIHALGNERVETPTLDSLVRTGCTFSRHHNMGSDRMPVCIPARAMLHSGRTLFHLEGPGGMTTEHPTLAEAFGNAGYRTYATGKWHNGTESFARSFDDGDTLFFHGMGNHWNVPVSSWYPPGEYPDPRPRRLDLGEGSVKSVQQSYDRYVSGTHSSELFTDSLVEFLRSHANSSEDRPFFAYMATMAPHDPRTAPGEYHERYDPADIELPDNVLPKHPFDNGELDIRDEHLENTPRDEANVRQHIADYYAMITHLDAQIGRVLTALEETGQYENTIVVYVGDHGLGLGSHGLMGKQNLYEHSVRVPFVVSGPGVPEDERRDVLSCHYDLYPTLCDLAGLDVPDSVDGETLVPAMDDPDVEPRDSLVLAYRDLHRAIREDRFKLIEYYVEGERRTQLFDLEADPSETTDLSDDDEFAAERERLSERLDARRAAMDDPMLDE